MYNISAALVKHPPLLYALCVVAFAQSLLTFLCPCARIAQLTLCSLLLLMNS